jgi:hypothetical protein
MLTAIDKIIADLEILIAMKEAQDHRSIRELKRYLIIAKKLKENVS